MKLVCPECGCIASAPGFVADATAREAMARLVQLPAPLPTVTISYLGLFRASSARSLSWKKALRLITEIHELVAKGYVSCQGKIDRTCPPATWAQAMEQMLEKREWLRLPMENHNYLRKVAHQLAEDQQQQTENSHHHSGHQHQRPTPQYCAEQPRPQPRPKRIEGIDPLEKARQEWDAKHGLPQKMGYEEFMQKVQEIGNGKNSNKQTQ